MYFGDILDWIKNAEISLLENLGYHNRKPNISRSRYIENITKTGRLVISSLIFQLSQHSNGLKNF